MHVTEDERDREYRDRDEGAVTLQSALEDLRDEIRARFTSATHQDLDADGVDWMALFDELRRRVNAIGIDERSGEVDAFGADEVVIRKTEPVLNLLQDRYWRVEVRGLEHVPTRAPCLFVANRSGLLPYDGLMISHVVSRGIPEGPRPRFMVADWLITLPFVQSYLARIGGVRASRENAERLLRMGHRVVAFPEGAKGAAKVFRDRYRLQRFGRGGVIRLALEARVPLIPVAVVGAEEVHPILFKLETMARAAGLPFVPVTPTFPWLGPLGFMPLPSKWSIRFGKPLPLEELGPEAVIDELLLARLTEELRSQIQSMVDEGVSARGSVWK